MCVFATIYTELKIPESPKFLYAQKRYHESRESLKRVNAFNTGETPDSDLFDFMFDTENEQNPVKEVRAINLESLNDEEEK